MELEVESGSGSRIFVSTRSLVRLLVCILHLENQGLDSSSHGHKLRVGTVVK